MISNPISVWDGENFVTFEYASGNKAWHFSSYDNGGGLEDNFLFFADCEANAFFTLRQMIETVIAAREKFNNFLKLGEIDYEPELLKRYKKYLKLLDESKLKITKAPTNQFYKIGWADNDTL